MPANRVNHVVDPSHLGGENFANGGTDLSMGLKLRWYETLQRVKSNFYILSEP